MTLKAGSCIDGPNVGEVRRRELDMPRDVSLAFALETLGAIGSGVYHSEDGHLVDWSAEVDRAVTVKESIPPEAVLAPLADARFRWTRATVANQTSLAAARGLADEGRRPLVLNMANGGTPGGGFLSGSRAQEEYLCRSSALYATLERDPMYPAHRRRDDMESTSWAILSPDVPVHRDDDARTLARPWPCSFLTMAAPVAHRVGQPRSSELMTERIDRWLHIAAARGYTDLVLGAWGCGAFGNDIEATAGAFHLALGGRFDGLFDQVVFAVTDWSPDRRFLGPFRDRFAR